MTTTQNLMQIEIAAKFWHDHADRCVEREVPITKGKGKRIVIELTAEEVLNLHDDAIHYSDATQFCYDGARAMATSARAVRKAIEQQVANLDDLLDAKAERIEARLSSDDYEAKVAANNDRIRELQEEQRRRMDIDPDLMSLRGRTVRIDGEWVVVASASYAYPCVIIRYADGRTFEVNNTSSTARCSQVGIEVMPQGE